MRYLSPKTLAKMAPLPIQTSQAITECKCERCKKIIKRWEKIVLVAPSPPPGKVLVKRLCRQCAAGVIGEYRQKLNAIDEELFGRSGA